VGGLEGTREIFFFQYRKNKDKLRTLSIWDFFFPIASSFMGILMVSFGEAMTIDRIAEYSLHMSLSLTVQQR
jgi:hypothetical protein